ncbi:permease prefix domain 1-containing protein [Edaphobacter paludis]|uniref:permease prefix domain 1-containing protein n=1 Tax=Edaphobacter paludis TaxID=3035702 RepID=UPI0035A008A9
MEADLEKELRFHFESQVADKIRSDIPKTEARRLTRIEFGGIEQIKEDASVELCGSSRFCRMSVTAFVSFERYRVLRSLQCWHSRWDWCERGHLNPCKRSTAEELLGGRPEGAGASGRPG